MGEKNMLNITESATKKLQEILDEESKFLRVFVEGGGCSGFTYGFTLEEVVSDEDFQIQVGDFYILVDPISLQYLQDSTISFEEDLSGSVFTIKNPNAQTTCGCGSSFSV
jgi:iron-sulfur cluster insertion protein